MTMPFYASAEQIMRDRSEYARKGIARGRSVVVLTYADGVLFVAENASFALHKVSEIYDRIGFAAVGKYNEYENLRVAGIRLADLRGYSYDRRDVTARALANAYAQTLGAIFTEQQKPYEVEICVAEVGDAPAEDQLYRLSYDGTIVDEPEFLVMGGQAESLTNEMRAAFTPGPAAARRARRRGRARSARPAARTGDPRALPASQLEVAVLDRTRGQAQVQADHRARAEPSCCRRRPPSRTTEPEPAETGTASRRRPPSSAEGESSSDAESSTRGPRAGVEPVGPGCDVFPL